jgi:hypothetical protein
MNLLKKLFIWITLALLFCQCEGMNRIEGQIVTADTKVPIDSVEIQYIEDRHTIVAYDTIYSDAVGHFEIGKLVMCIPKCPQVTLKINKSGYKSKTISFENGINDTTLSIELVSANNVGTK